jgi:hypothetical protein
MVDHSVEITRLKKALFFISLLPLISMFGEGQGRASTSHVSPSLHLSDICSRF